MLALGHHPKHLGVFELAETDGTGGFLIIQALISPRELGVRVDDALVETNDGRVIVVAQVVVVLGDEDNTGEHNAVGGRMGIWGRRRAGVAGGAATDVGSEEESGEEDEEAESDGDGVPEADIGDVDRGIGGRVWTGGGGHWETEGGDGGVLAISICFLR